jgi:nucleoside-diphosphate-sugar epimerase
MRVFVAGATGVIGRRLVPRLVERGHRVTGLTRTPGKAGAVRAAGAEPAVADGLDGAAVGEAVARAAPDTVVHQMTALTGMRHLRRFDREFAVTNALRTTGTDHLLAAALAAGAGRFVAQSYTGWTHARVGGPIKTEVDPLDPDPPRAQRRSLDAIRHLERAVLEAPLHGVLLRYGSFYGAEASGPLLELVRARRLPIVGDGGGIWSWIHVDDAVAATVAAVEGDTRGIYQVVDDEPAPVADWLPHLARVVGAKPPVRVPAWLGRLLAGEVAVSLMTRVRGSSNAKARRELGWQPEWPSWREGFEAALGRHAAPRRRGAA